MVVQRQLYTAISQHMLIRFFRLNLGRGRHLPPNPVLHHSVRERLQAKPEDFGPGDGYSIPETRYKIEGHFAKGESLATAQWDDGGVYEA